MSGIPFVITRQKKVDLRAVGFSDEEIRNLTPQDAEDILTAVKIAKTDGHEVREFIEIFVAQARAATEEVMPPRTLQMVRVHPLAADYNDVVTCRYDLD